MFNKEIFMLVEGRGAVTLQYHDETVFNTMLARCRQWERDGKLTIVDVRDSEYVV